MTPTPTAPILLVTTGGGIGGEESFTTGLAESLLRRGWDVRVAAVGAPHIAELRRRNIPVVDLPTSSRNPLGLLRGAKALARFASDNAIRLIHSQSVGPALMTLLAK
ncbi:MAG: glycosyltransferase, partial [Planctomycetota bacterium]|nr:glycosyltransferase [Planctomycetota bacterium]